MHSSYIILCLGTFLCSHFIDVSSKPAELESQKSFFWVNHDSDKIVGGASCTPAHQASLQSRNSHFCGGSIMCENCIISAAHCVSGSSASSVKVKCGAHSLNSADMGIYNVEKISVHPGYSSSTVDSDVSILKLKEAIPLGGNYSTAKIDLAPAGTEYPEGLLMTTSGYGTTSESGSLSTQCMCVDVPVVSHQKCNQAYSDKITSKMLCAGTAGKDSCQGDSGGPLVVDGTLAGIVSWGRGCAREGYPGVYAKVADPEINNWILTTAASMGCTGY